MKAIPRSVFEMDPLLSLRFGGAALADLAFGSESPAVDAAIGRPLAMLTPETLQLDLSDPAQRLFGDYELLELIGEGGMGVVYRARQISLDREVAVKLLASGPWASREFVERFRREAQNAARMQHPNIVAIYEVGSAETLHFFSMRLIRGPSLATVIKQSGPMPPQRAAILMRTVAEAVDYAHSLGVLHLDLKPANVLLESDGSPHVADFGLARRLEQGSSADNEEISGTPSYMAPEQAAVRSGKITPATDIWGLGAILYELLTGKPPFAADTPQATLKLVSEGELRSPRRDAPHLSRDLEAIVSKCMQHDPAARYSSARALADDLARYVDGRPVQARPLNAAQRIARWSRREPKLAIATCCAIATLVLGLIATTTQWRHAQDNARLAANSAALANERLWQTRLDQAESDLRNGHPYAALPELAANISEREALRLDASDDRLRFAMVGRNAPQLIDVITLDTDIAGVGLSPDGKFVAVSSGDSTMRLFDAASGRQKWSMALTGMPYVFRPNPILVALQFTPDGRRILGHDYWGGAGLGLPSPLGEGEALVDATTGKQLLPPEKKFPLYYDAVFSPDGEYAVVEGKDDTAALMRTSDWTLLSPRVPMPRQTWRVGNGGRYVISMSNFHTLQVRDPHTLRVRYSYTYSAAQSISAWATSPDGNALLLGHADGLIEWLDLTHNKREHVMPGALSRVGWVAFSPDGRRFGAVSDSGDVLTWHAQTRQPAGPPLHIDAGLGPHHQRLSLDPGGRWVLAAIDQQMTLWSVQAHTPHRITGEFPHARPGAPRAFDFNGDLVATGGDEGELRLWRLPRGMPHLIAPVLPGATPNAADPIVVAVNENTMRLGRVRDGSAAGAAITLPQAPAFAERTVDGRVLVAVVGHRLQVYDLPSAMLRFTPPAIPNYPVRVTLSPDSRHAFIAYGDYRKGRAVDVASIWDLGTGHPVSDQIATPPCDAIEYAPDGRSLLTCGVLRDAVSLLPRWTYRSAGAQEVRRMRYAANGNEVLALVVAKSGENYLLHLDIGTGLERRRQLLRGVRKSWNFAMLPDGRSLVLQRGDAVGPAVWRDDRRPAVGEVLDVEQTPALALAPDGHTFARGTTDGVVLTSARDARWITPDLRAGLDTSDAIMSLAYTRDGNGIVGRSFLGNWLYWNTAADDRPAADLLRVAQLLHPGIDALQKKGAAVPLTMMERAALRRADSGSVSPEPAIASASVPRRPPGLSPLLFDLGPYYNRPLAATEQSDAFDVDLSQFVPGVHRLLGIDYDARGVISMTNEQKTSAGFPTRVAGIRPGVPRFAALDALVSAQTMLRTQEQVPYAFVELDYRDGTRARLPIVYNRDIKEWWRTDWDTPGRIAWRLRDFGGEDWPDAYPSMVAVRLVNPYPQREVASLALEAAPTQFSAPAFIAITAEPVKQ